MTWVTVFKNGREFLIRDLVLLNYDKGRSIDIFSSGK